MAGIVVTLFIILSVQSASAIEFNSVEEAIKNEIPKFLEKIESNNPEEILPTCLLSFFPILTIFIIMLLSFTWRLLKFGLTLVIIATIVGTILRIIDEDQNPA